MEHQMLGQRVICPGEPTNQSIILQNVGFLFSLKSRTFVLGQTNCADNFWVIWSIFSQTISTHFVTVSPLSMFFIIQQFFLQKNLSLYIHIPNIDLGFEFGLERIRNLSFMCPQSVLWINLQLMLFVLPRHQSLSL